MAATNFDSIILDDGGITSSGASTLGASTKDVKTTVKGYTQFDYRPTGGGTNSYALQVRHNVGSTSGDIISLDHEAHITATGTASLRGVQGVAVVDTSKTTTLTSKTITGVYGQARVDGTLAGTGFLTGLYGVIEASSAMTASHVASLWVDSHQANTVTGNHELIYATNNGAATMDSVMYIYGGDKITNFLTLNTVGGMVSDTATTSGTSKKIKIDIDGTTYYINAYTG